MKKKIIFLVPILLMVISPALAAEKTMDQKILSLEKKLQETSGKEKVKVLNDLAYMYYTKSPETCIQLANQALKSARELKIKKQEARALINIGLAQYVSGDYQGALEYFQNAYPIYKKLQDKKAIASTLNKLGLANKNLGNSQKALEYYNESLKIKKELGDKKGISSSFNNMGVLYGKCGQYDKALEFQLKALEMDEEIGDKSRIASSLNNVGVIYYSLSNYEKALEYYLKSLKIKEEIGDIGMTASSLDNIGAVYERLGHYDKALECHLKSLTILQETGNKREMANSLNSIALVYYHLKKYDQALEYHEKSLKISQETGNKFAVARSLNNMGVIYYESGQYRKALAYHLDALKKREETGDRSGISSSLSNIGDIYQQLNQNDKALKCHLESLKITEKIGYQFGIARSLNKVGALYTKRQQYGKALANLERSLKIAKELDAAGLIRDNYEYFSQLYAARGDYKKALEFHQRFYQTDKKIFNQESSQQLNELQTRYETTKKAKEITVLKKNNEIQALRLSNARITRNAFIIGFALVVIILVLLFKKYLYLFSFWKKQKYVGQFRLLEKIGSGAMASIYKAKSIVNKTDIAAVKIFKEELFNDESSKKRFKREAAIIDKLDHPHIIKVIERGEHRENLFIAMEFLQGKTLEQKIKEESPLPIEDCVHIMLQISDALGFIHSKNIIHRDLKPANIMLVEKNGDFNYTKLLDFGLARMESQTRLTQSGNFVGTLEYIPPEQFLHSDSSPANDIFAAGVTFYTMLCGQTPFPGDTVIDIMRQIISETPKDPSEIRPDIPQELNDLVMNMMHKKPEHRPSIEAIIQTLKAL